MKTAKGFTILEGIITLSVVAILMGIAFPAYQRYTRRIYFNDIVKIVEPYKVSVMECYKLKKKLSVCNAGTNKIPAAITTNKDGIASLSVSKGTITVTPIMQNGIKTTDTYVLTPTVSNNSLVWKTSGGAVTNRYAK